MGVTVRSLAGSLNNLSPGVCRRDSIYRVPCRTPIWTKRDRRTVRHAAPNARWALAVCLGVNSERPAIFATHTNGLFRACRSSTNPRQKSKHALWCLTFDSLTIFVHSRFSEPESHRGPICSGRNALKTNPSHFGRWP